MVGEEVGVGVIGAAVMGAAVMGAAVGEDDGVFVGAFDVAGTKIVGRLVVPGLGMVVIVDGAGGGLAVSCARAVLVPPVAESTMAATSHIFLPLVYMLSFSRWTISSSECDVGSKDANILKWKEIDDNNEAICRRKSAAQSERRSRSDVPEKNMWLQQRPNEGRGNEGQWL